MLGFFDGLARQRADIDPTKGDLDTSSLELSNLKELLGESPQTPSRLLDHLDTLVLLPGSKTPPVRQER